MGSKYTGVYRMYTWYNVHTRMYWPIRKVQYEQAGVRHPDTMPNDDR
jgi:hypothetical protein